MPNAKTPAAPTPPPTPPPGPPRPLDFRELDLRAIQKELHIDAAAAENGRRNLPPQDSPAPDAVEEAVAARFLAERNALHSEVLTQMRIWAERFAGLRFQERFSRLEHLPADAEARLSTLSGSRLDGLLRLRADRESLRREREAFAAEHGLARTARYPESRLLRLGLLLLLLVVETALNGMFFARGHELGLLGGATQAVVLSVINIGLGLFVGLKLLPQTRHKDAARRILGWCGLALYLAFLAGFNLAVAHYREAFALHPAEAARLAVESLLARPLFLAEFDSWLLLLLGLLCSAVAFADGAGLDDPYPGFGRLDRRLRTAEEDFFAGKRDLLAGIEAVKDQSLAAVDAHVRDIETRRAEAHSILLACVSLSRKYAARREYLERCANTVLRAYRDANQAARSSLPPTRFAEPFALPPDDGLPPPPELDARLTAQIEQTLAQASGHKARILAGHDRALSALIEQLGPAEETRP
jgi:hypothetical protein